MEIRAHPAPYCYVCGSQGTVRYENQQDPAFGAPGFWNIKVCGNPDCGLMWLDPQPDERDIEKAYARYFTHPEEEQGTPSDVTPASIAMWRKWVRPVVSLLSLAHHERQRLSLMYLQGARPGRLLDVGCGGGLRLSQLRERGWDVYGQDVDAVAVAHARATFRLDVRLGRLQDVGFPEAFFDRVVSNHVIEHVHDPVQLLTECRRLLKRGGRLLLVTPNTKSYGHRCFGPVWRALDPPRHLHLFSPQTLATIVRRAGFSVSRSWTTAANANYVAHASLLWKDGAHGRAGLYSRLTQHAQVVAFQVRASLQHLADPDSGEECVLEAIS